MKREFHRPRPQIRDFPIRPGDRCARWEGVFRWEEENPNLRAYPLCTR